MKRYGIIISALFATLTGWQCSKMEQRADLKQSLLNSAGDVNMAVSRISGTQGYELITMRDDDRKAAIGGNLVTDDKSGSSYRLVDSIYLELVAGIFEYQPDPFRHHHYFFPASFFKKTGENDHMIINMPQRKMFRPGYLFNYCTCDTVKTNNFTIDASAYHLYYSGWNTFDYKLTAGFILDKEGIGDCDIVSKVSREEGQFHSSKFNFTDGVNIVVTKASGDTTEKSFSLNDKDEVLLMEKNTFIRSGYKINEKEYLLTIGNVDIKKSSEIDSIQVFLDGVLQKKAAAKIIDDDDEEKSICRKRDLEITFNDGTTTKLSTLISPAKETLKTVVSSLNDMYFARQIVDYLALNVYFNDHDSD